MVKFNFTFDERIPEILTIIKGVKNNPYSSGELADMFSAYVAKKYDFDDNSTVKDVYDSDLSENINSDFADFLFDAFGVSNFVEIYPQDYGYHYSDNTVSYIFDLLD